MERKHIIYLAIIALLLISVVVYSGYRLSVVDTANLRTYHINGVRVDVEAGWHNLTETSSQCRTQLQDISVANDSVGFKGETHGGRNGYDCDGTSFGGTISFPDVKLADVEKITFHRNINVNLCGDHRYMSGNSVIMGHSIRLVEDPGGEGNTCIHEGFNSDIIIRNDGDIVELKAPEGTFIWLVGNQPEYFQNSFGAGVAMHDDVQVTVSMVITDVQVTYKPGSGGGGTNMCMHDSDCEDNQVCQPENTDGTGPLICMDEPQLSWFAKIWAWIRSIFT